MGGSNETLSLKAAAAVAHIEPNELRHTAQRGEIDAMLRGGEWYFLRRDIDEWMQRHLLSAREKELAKCHRSMADEHRRRGMATAGTLVGSLLREDCISLSLAAKAKPGVVRDMTDLAAMCGLVYDEESLFRELLAREEAASTAIGEGVAFLHPRYHDPYMFEDSCLADARSAEPVFVGAPDGAGTRHFFLICANDRDLHLHVLARLAVLAHGAGLVAKLDEAASPGDVMAAVREAEAEYAK